MNAPVPRPTKHCVVAYATRDRQYLWRVELPPEASVEDALVAAREVEAREVAEREDAESGARLAIRWQEAEVGIFGELCSRTRIPEDGDRIEIYRPLASDPRQARRERTRQLRAREREPR